MRKTIGIYLLSIAFLMGSSAIALVKELPADQWQEELQTIDKAINKLTGLRDKELAKAARAQDQGDRLQFQSHNLLDARRAWQEADTSREIAARYQQEIDKLELRKQTILKKQGIDYEYTPQSPPLEGS